MKPTYKFAAGVIASLGLGIAVATAYANPGQMGGGMEHGKGGMQHGAKGGMKHGAQGGMQHGKEGMEHGKSGSQHGRMGGDAGHGAGQQLLTPEERTAMREKMRNAKTPEERQQIAAANRAEMQKRATEKGITLPEGRGPRHGATTEHQH
jgi:hypothetical protein